MCCNIQTQTHLQYMNLGLRALQNVCTGHGTSQLLLVADRRHNSPVEIIRIHVKFVTLRPHVFTCDSEQTKFKIHTSLREELYRLTVYRTGSLYVLRKNKSPPSNLHHFRQNVSRLTSSGHGQNYTLQVQ